MAHSWTAPGSLISPLLTPVLTESVAAAVSPAPRELRPDPSPPEARAIEDVVAPVPGPIASAPAVGQVLLLTDGPSGADELTRALGDDACTVLPFAAADDPATFAGEAQPGLIVVDTPEVAERLGLVRRLRGSDRTGKLALLVLTDDPSVEGRIAALEAGADDVLARPFSDEELMARAETLVRRVERTVTGPAAAAAEAPRTGMARLIAVHSLRGGVGATSIAVNLALQLRAMWDAQVILLDLVPEAGQAGFYLDAKSPRSWAQLIERASSGSVRDEIDWVTIHHQSGIDLIASPDHEPPELQDPLPLIEESIASVAERYDYVVADLPHDLGRIARRMLDLADVIVLPVAPDLASVRSASIALAWYRERGYPVEKTRVIVNATMGRGTVPTADIEKGLHERVEVVLPYAPDVFLAAVNSGRPIVTGDPDQPAARLIGDLAYRISLTRHLLDETRDPTAPEGRLRDRQTGRSSGRGGRRTWALLGRNARS